MHVLPAEAEPLQDPRAEILHDHVARLDQIDQHVLPHRVLEVDRDGSLVAVEHREVEAVGVGDVAQLSAGHVARRRFQLDDVRAQKAHELAAGGPGLNVRHVEHADTGKCFVHECLAAL